MEERQAVPESREARHDLGQIYFEPSHKYWAVISESNSHFGWTRLPLTAEDWRAELEFVSSFSCPLQKRSHGVFKCELSLVKL